MIIRSGHLGAYVLTASHGKWIPAFWESAANEPTHDSHVVDVTGAGNAFLGGLSAGLSFTSDVYEGMLLYILLRSIQS